MSKTYFRRLEKYAYRHGFAVGVPCYNPSLLARRVCMEKYIYIKDRDILSKIEHYGMPGSRDINVECRNHQCTVECDFVHRVSSIHGMERIIIWDAYSKGVITVTHVHSPSVASIDKYLGRDCSASSLNTVVVKSAAVPGIYYLLWGTVLHEGADALDDSDDLNDGCYDIDGYCCTPITRAYALFDRLLDEQLLTDKPDGGAVTRVLSRTMHLQNGHVAADISARNLDPSVRTTEPLNFVFDFVSCESTTFEMLRYVQDAASPPMQDLDDDEFLSTYKLPRKLRFVPYEPRAPPDCDMFAGVYC